MSWLQRLSMRRHPLVRIAASMLALTTVVALPTPARAEVFVSVTFAPPPLPVYAQPMIPGPGYIWTPGYWAWGGDGYYWVPGTWVLAPFIVGNEHVRKVIEEDRKLPVRLKLNLRYGAASVQAAQASFFGVLVFAGFLFLGLVSIPEATITAWTSKPPAIVELGPVNIPGRW